MVKPDSVTITSSFFVIATACLVVAILIIGKPILAPLALSFLFAFILNPVVRFLEKRGLKRNFAVSIVATVVFSVLFGLTTALVVQLQSLAIELPSHTKEIEQKIASLRSNSNSAFSGVWKMVDRVTANVAEASEAENTQAGQEKPIVVVTEDKPSGWLSSVPTFVVLALGPLATGALVAVLTIFMLISREDLRNRMLAIIGRSRLSRTTRILDDTSTRLSKYLLGLVSVNMGFAVAFTAVLFFVGVPYAAVWGSVSFFFRFIPLLGSAVSMLLPLIVSIATLPGWIPPLIIVGTYLALEAITGNFIEPFLFGRSVGMNPFALLLAIMFWTWAWGPLGLMLATPLSLVIVTLGRHLACFSALDHLLGDARPLPHHVVFFQRILADDTVEATSLYQELSKDRGAAFAMQEVIYKGLQHADRELRAKAIRREDHAKVLKVADAIILDAAKLISKTSDEQATTQTVETMDSATSILAMVGNGRASIALDVIAHSHPEQNWRRYQRLTQRIAAKLVQDGVPLVILSEIPQNGVADVEASVRLLRRLGYEGWIAVGYWKSRGLTFELRQQFKQAGADYVTHRMHSMARIVGRFLEHQKEETEAIGDISIQKNSGQHDLVLEEEDSDEKINRQFEKTVYATL
jgi:predicted PurR-regulated permease PerM